MASLRTSGRALDKVPSGIRGLDEITFGGLPKGRTALICGQAGSGKTIMAMEFIVRGATDYGEPGVFMAFEETPEELAENVSSLGFDLDKLVAEKKIEVDYVYIERSEIQETGEYDLDGLFIRLGHAIDSIGAKRVALDTLETLFSGLTNTGILRAELRRLFRWLKDKGVTAVITAERGEGTFTRYGLEEYISDCVITLDHRVTEQVATRRLRVVKYRGTSHGTNEYPFLIDEGGVDVLPITSIGLDHEIKGGRVSTGFPGLDEMLDGKGYYRGSSMLVSGTAGTGKSTLAATFVEAACRRGEKAMYFAFEESPSQIMRNMRSVGINLEPWFQQGVLQLRSARPTAHGLEAHLTTMYKSIRDFQPDVVVVDPITNLISVGTYQETKSMLTRLVDLLKSQHITGLFTNLVHGTGVLSPEHSDVGVSSIIDTWILLREIELNGERNRALYILKSRGMAHSNQLREFLISSDGLSLVDVYLGPEGVLTGSARLAQEAREAAAAELRAQEIERKQRDLDRKRIAMEAQIAALRTSLEAEEEELQRTIAEAKSQEEQLESDRSAMAASRRAGRRGNSKGRGN